MFDEHGTLIPITNHTLIRSIENLDKIFYIFRWQTLKCSKFVLEKSQRFFRRISEWKSRCLGQRCRWPLNMINCAQVSWRRHFITSFVGDELWHNSWELHSVRDRRNYSIKNFLMGEILYHISQKQASFVMEDCKFRDCWTSWRAI